MNSIPKFLSFYLPQYHPIPENDEWWGKGFTEWTNVTKMKPLFKGHEQPKLPADLGYYDLRVAETREQQADMAKEYGVNGFIYYHYWFGNGKRILERPFDEVLQSGKPDFPFCLCWANESWSGIWHGVPGKILMEQLYPGREDIEAHFKLLLKAFRDNRYILVDGKPLFIVYNPLNLPDSNFFCSVMRELAEAAGLKGIYLMAGNVAPDEWPYKENGFDGKISHAFNKSLIKLSATLPMEWRIKLKLGADMKKRLKIVDHRKLVADMNFPDDADELYPMIVPNWDNSPRSGRRGLILTQSSGELFREQLDKAAAYIESSSSKEKIVFVKSWNEWAEGNFLEPDSRIGFGFLEEIKKFKHNQQLAQPVK